MNVLNTFLILETVAKMLYYRIKHLGRLGLYWITLICQGLKSINWI